MNSLDDEIAQALDASWGTKYAAHQAYQKQAMTEQSPKTIRVDPILAGVQACMLAAQMLRIEWDDPQDIDARVGVAIAKEVLATWGIELRTLDVPPPDSSESNPPPVLAWPPVNTLGRPLTTTLPDVYRENYYHVREMTVVTNPDAMSGIRIEPEHKLVLREAYWNEEALQWRMRFTCWNLPNVDPFWIDHCKVKVGDEIPKDPAP